MLPWKRFCYLPFLERCIHRYSTHQRENFVHMSRICYFGKKLSLRCSSSSTSNDSPIDRSGKTYDQLQRSPIYTKMSSTIGLITPPFLQANNFLDRAAIFDRFGTHTYEEILSNSQLLADKILDRLKITDDTKGERICLMCTNDVSYVVAQWATWMTGSISVPLSGSYPETVLKYFIENSKAKLVISTEDFAEKAKSCLSDMTDVHHLTLDKSDYSSISDDFDEAGIGSDEQDSHLEAKNLRWNVRNNKYNQLQSANKFKHRSALIVYTSGTTGKPKGVLHTFGSLQAQMVGMITAWGWNANDCVLHVLPLHHIHGIVNVLMTPLFCGALCVMMPHFDSREVWSYILSTGDHKLPRKINMFMAVPTIYSKLIESYENRVNRGRGTKKVKDFIKEMCSSRIRLFVSGSAPLPTSVLHRWEEITGHRLLERYGMTELGMALTNPLKGHREPGAVGQPFPYVEVAIVKPNVYGKYGYDLLAQGNHRKTVVTKGCENQEGDLYVRGATVFKEYWEKPEATKETFTKDGWFKTGDTAVYRDSTYRILGRTSVDIIKNGGYKISALEIERCLLMHSSVKEVAVLGLPDITWGQKIAAVVVLKPGNSLSLSELKEWAKEVMPHQNIPTVLKIVPDLSRNAMGKINKKQLMAELFSTK